VKLSEEFKALPESFNKSVAHWQAIFDSTEPQQRMAFPTPFD